MNTDKPRKASSAPAWPPMLDETKIASLRRNKRFQIMFEDLALLFSRVETVLKDAPVTSLPASSYSTNSYDLRQILNDTGLTTDNDGRALQNSIASGGQSVEAVFKTREQLRYTLLDIRHRTNQVQSDFRDFSSVRNAGRSSIIVAVTNLNDSLGRSNKTFSQITQPADVDNPPAHLCRAVFTEAKTAVDKIHTSLDEVRVAAQEANAKIAIASPIPKTTDPKNPDPVTVNYVSSRETQAVSGRISELSRVSSDMASTDGAFRATASPSFVYALGHLNNQQFEDVKADYKKLQDANARIEDPQKRTNSDANGLVGIVGAYYYSSQPKSSEANDAYSRRVNSTSYTDTPRTLFELKAQRDIKANLGTDIGPPERLDENQSAIAGIYDKYESGSISLEQAYRQAVKLEENN